MRTGGRGAGRVARSLIELLVAVVVVGVLAAGTAVTGSALVDHTQRSTLLAELYAHGKAGLAHARLDDTGELATGDFVATAPRLEQVTDADDPAPSQPHAAAVWLHGTHDTTVLVLVSVERDRVVLAGSRAGQTAAVAVSWAGQATDSTVVYQVDFDDSHDSDGSTGDADVDAADAVEETHAADGDDGGGEGGPPCLPPGQGGQAPGRGGLIPGTCELVPPYAEDD